LAYLFRLDLATLEAALGNGGFSTFMNTKRWETEQGGTQRPMDLSIDCATGVIVDMKYGINPNDQWSHKEIKEHGDRLKFKVNYVFIE
jgi:hypothetical protein